jgi:DNA helicase-2/ATP-dependent DNA helicase PcrA
VLNAVDGCIPSDRAAGETEEIEEERRLLYVAMTRAKNEFDLIVPQRFYAHQQSRSGDRHLYASRTRFIPDALLRFLRATHLAGTGDDDARGRHRRGAGRCRGKAAGTMAVKTRT